MYLETKQDRSVYYFVAGLFTDVTNINFTDDFPSTELVLPTISIERLDIDSYPHELGNRIGRAVGFWRINIFAKNKTQRDEYAYRIRNSIETYIPVYNYDEGFPPEYSPSQLGTLTIDKLKLTPIQVFAELSEMLYWRSELTFRTNYEQCT